VSLPRTSRIFYSTKIKRGWKAGTKLIFKQPGIDVVFVLDEGKHDRFVRDGNDLKTTVTIGQTKAAKGCTILIDPLGVHELPIMVKLKKGEVTHDRYVVEVKGRGWPQNDGKRGNLLVTIKVVSDAKAKRVNKIRVKRRGN
jgi:DnaJ-class molecular chaperone